MGRKPIDLTGKRFGKLEVAERAGTDQKTRNPIWRCICDCGKETYVTGDNLRRGNTKSCGCMVGFQTGTENPNYSGGHSSTQLYRVWVAIKTRCENKNHKHYIHYGGRGIRMCEEWANNFEVFYAWAIASGYKQGLTIDRIDVNGNYEPSNCRWATVKQQLRNKRNNIRVEINGETRTLSEWAEISRLPRGIIYKRYHNGDRGEALLRPLNG